VPAAELGARDAEGGDGVVRVAGLDVRAAAGAGALDGSEAAVAHIGFDAAWLRRLSGSGAAHLSLIRVQGDSMVPTLADGDDILVDRGDAAARLRDGIYVLRRDDALLVKRLAVSPAGRTVTVKSDNPAYPEWRDCDLASLEVIGRVVWAGRRIG
jgi:phage repressor protein C with HTH and peptisase S24 domain